MVIMWCFFRAWFARLEWVLVLCGCMVLLCAAMNEMYKALKLFVGILMH